MNKASRTILAAAVAAAAALAAGLGCQDSLAIKDYVKQQVDVANTHLALTEIATSAPIPVGGTAIWPATIFTETSTRTFRLTNTGSDVVTLVGANPVAVTGGSGQAAYGGIVQPVQLVLQPGDSTTFSVSFTPPAADTDYICNMVINSDDSKNPAFKFDGRGHSTQWHGSKAVVSTASGISYSYPKIAIVGSTVYLAYQKYNSSTASDRGIVLRYSTNGGSSWSPEAIVVSAATNSISGFSFAASSSTLHLFYYDSTAGALYYTTSPSPPNAVNFSGNYVGTFSYATSYYTSNNNVIALANGYVYIAAYNNTDKKLTLAVRGDQVPNMGNPNFSYYTITDATTHTGGFNASIKVNSSNVFLSYADSGLVRAAIVPLSGGTPSGVYTYRTIYIDPSYNVGSNSLIVDSAKAYAFWGMSGGSPLRFASSTNLLLSSWSTPMELAGEQNNLSPTTQFSLFDGTFYVLHESYSGPHTYSLRLSTSSDGGVTWNSGYVDDSAGLDASASAMSVSGSTQYIVYSTSSSHPNGYSITLKKSLDGGTTW